MKQHMYRIFSVALQSLGVLSGSLQRLLRQTSITSTVIFGSLMLGVAGIVFAVLSNQPSAGVDVVHNQQMQERILLPVLETTESESKMSNSQQLDSGSEASNNSETTVTVNGNTVYVPNGESYERSYEEEPDGSRTDIEIVVKSNQTRLHVRSESSSTSSSSTNTSINTQN
jgi:hypothetical protein